MFIPKEYKKNINPYSGYIDFRSKYAKLSAESLFLTQYNIVYLGKLTFTLLTSPKYIDSVGGNPDLAKDFQNDPYIKDNIMEQVEYYKFPRSFLVSNPITQLSQINRDFAVTTAKNIVHNYRISSKYMNNLHQNVNDITGENEDHLFAQYSAKSYADGRWHPEDLFLTPISDNVWKKIDVKSEDPRLRWGKDHGGIRFWVRTPHNRHYDREQDGLFDGGRSDRRLQIPRGYAS